MPRVLDKPGAFSFVVPAGWRTSDAAQLEYGSALLIMGDVVDASILLGRLDEKLFAGAEPDNTQAAIRLCSDMGEFFMPFPGMRRDQQGAPISAGGVAGATSHFRVTFNDRSKQDGEIWCAAVGSGYQRWFVVWLGTSIHPVDKRAAIALTESIRPT